MKLILHSISIWFTAHYPLPFYPLRFIDPDGMDPEETLEQWNDRMSQMIASRTIWAPFEAQVSADDDGEEGGGDGGKKKKKEQPAAQASTPAPAAKEAPKTKQQEFLELLSKTTGYFSLSSDAIKEIGGFDKAMELLKSGKFTAEYNGQTKVWNLNFYGNKTVSGAFVAAAKSDFEYLAKAGKVIHAGLETTSKIFGWLGAATSVAAFIVKPTVKNGADVVMSGVAFVPVVGWALSGAYFIVDQTVGWDKVLEALDQKQYREESIKENCHICLLDH